MKSKLKSIFHLSYDPEADVLSWEMSEKPIDYATEMGNMIVHFSRTHQPVLVEILQAKDFLRQTKQMVRPQHHRLAQMA
ncbi:MAG: DUF2283 domain-containing protein [Candidatus Magasanikbacteria bacterium]|nr:DUF2283 domain-containing protein [Candidatus Magasanikbacteria bacterium]